MTRAKSSRRPETKERPVAVLFLGDMHAGGDTAVAPAGFWMESKSRIYPLSEAQEMLLKHWNALVETARTVAKTHDLQVRLGGDLVDGPQHHGTAQTTGTADEMRAMAIELLQPLADIATALYSVDGTDAHVGPEGEQDNSIARALGAEFQPHFRQPVGGRLLDWRHDGIHVSQRPHLKMAAMLRTAMDEYLDSTESGWPVADLIVRHHAHRSPMPVTVYGVTCVLCGCWQMPTHWASKGFSRTPDIGALLWYPETMQVERLLYGKSE